VTGVKTQLAMLDATLVGSTMGFMRGVHFLLCNLCVRLSKFVQHVVLLAYFSELRTCFST
jgi:hypothetical protein